MAIQSLNSVGGFSVKDGSGDIVIIIDSNGNVSTPDLTVTGLSNLGAVGNITITGGSSGYVLSTDGSGTLSWAAPGGGGGNTEITSPMPYYIDSTETYYVTANHQGLFSLPIEIDGTLEVDGVLVDVNTAISGSPNQLLYNNSSQVAGIPTATYDGSNLNLGSSSTLKITGGTNGYVLQTDGTGNLSWTAQTGGGSGGVAGANTQVQFNDAGDFGANAGFTFNKTSGLLTAPYISGDGSNLTNVSVSSATTAGTVTTAAQPNITSVGTLTTVSVSGNANVGNIGTGGLITATGNITGGNLVTGGALSVTGNANVGNIGTAGLITATGNITGGNLVTGGALSVTGNANVGNLGTSNLVIASGGYTTTSTTDINGWSYANVSKSVATEDTTTTGLFFRSNGNSMYLAGTTSDKIYQYNLSSAWNVSTATLYGNVSVLTQDTTMNDIFIDSSGVNLYAVGDTANTVFQYTMATPWDITTATYASKSFSVATQETTPSGIFFSPDLANMYVAGSNADAVFQYTLSTPGDVSTATYASKTVSIAGQETGVTALSFNSSGNTMYVVGTTNATVFSYNLGTAWDVSTATYGYGNSFGVFLQESTPTGLYTDIANSRVWVSGQSADGVFQYNTNGAVITTASAVGVEGQLDVSGNVYVNGGIQLGGVIRTASALSVGSTATVASTLTGASTVTFSTTTSTISIGASQTTGTTTIGGTAQTGNILIGQSTATQILNIGVGVTSNANTKTINIGTGSTGTTSNTSINIGSAAAPANVTFNANTTVYIANTGSALSVTGNANIGNIGTAGLITATGNLNAGNIITAGIMSSTGNATHGNIITGGLITATGNITGGNIITAGIMSSTGNATHGNISVNGTITANGATNSTAFAVGNSATSNCAVAMTPTAGTPGEYAFRDYSTVTSTMYFDVGMGGTANGQFNFRTTNSYTTLANVNIYGITLTTNRPAFRVTGSGTTTNLTTTQNGTGALNSNNWTVDYSQSGALNSTTGVFTAPVAGLYQINIVGRNSGYSGGISQLAVVKNATGGTGSGGAVMCMIEWAASSSMNHVGSSTTAKLAVNDTLALKVLAGQINFDGNDNWSIAYLG